MSLMQRFLRARVLASAVLAFAFGTVDAAVGLTEVAGLDGDGPVTVLYPTAAAARQVTRGPFTFTLAEQGVPARGNGRLVVLSHGSGGSVWTYGDLGQALVDAGFVVALPEHQGDNFKDKSLSGPQSWKLRPGEVSRAIDAVAHDARFKSLVDFQRVGVYGMSAGGHTALSLAGGRWSPSRLKAHCTAHLAEDYHGCVGLSDTLTGGAFDTMKKSIALWVISAKLNDPAWYTHSDKRIAAVVAAVPFASDFDLNSLTRPRVPLGLVTARLDKWLLPRFHSDRVLAACTTCERIADFARGGHGAVLSPMPPGLSGLAYELVRDPPGFDRSETKTVNQKIVGFFRKHLAS
jgi:predicted dienelactone hydrolase